jgi:hypothetical protein
MLRQSSYLILILAGLAQSPRAMAQFSGSFSAQPGIDLSGAWSPAPHEENIGNPAIADFLGVPINEAARAVGLAWSPSRVTVPEHQCQVHVAPYLLGGPLNLRIWEERDNQAQKLQDIRMYISTYEQNRTIWMDDRPHPPEAAAHTWMGFSTGKWEGNILTVTTTHIKQGWTRRNGLPSSDLMTLTEHFIRHGNHLTHVSIATDPVYLSEPLIKSQDYLLNEASDGNWLWPCEYVDETPGRPQGKVPSYMPGENPFLSEFAKRYGLPQDAVLGGAETMYPDYKSKIAEAK